jgi:hypothetical protein
MDLRNLRPGGRGALSRRDRDRRRRLFRGRRNLRRNDQLDQRPIGIGEPDAGLVGERMRAGELDALVLQALHDLVEILGIGAEADVLEALGSLALEYLAPAMRVAVAAQVGAAAHAADIQTEIGVELYGGGEIGNAEDETVKGMHGGRCAVPAHG